MRPSLISLFALALAAGPSLAQTETATPAAPAAAAPTSSTAAAPTSSTAPAVNSTAATPATAPAAPGAAPAAPGAASASQAAPLPEAAPATPPAPPTDPTAIALLSTLEKVCIPAIEGGKLDKLSKAEGFRKADNGFVKKGPGFQFTLLPFGSNPDTCEVDVTSPIDPEAPAKPLVVALHNWATAGHGFSLYRNDKNSQTGQQISTRSWELTKDGKYSALVLTTYRKADGTPASSKGESSIMIYSERPAPAGS